MAVVIGIGVLLAWFWRRQPAVLWGAASMAALAAILWLADRWQRERQAVTRFTDEFGKQSYQAIVEALGQKQG
jgi:hypothetical protein